MSHDIEHEHEDKNHGQGGQIGYYHGTDYALPYVSPWSRIVSEDDVNARMLAHMNCSYLGTPGHPPTLHALKQHAQSLALLISYLDPSLHSGRVDGQRQGDWDARDSDDGTATAPKDPYVLNPKRRLEMGSAFDWLADLGVPYQNDDPEHWKPLNALMNEVESRNDADDTLFRCPLTDVPPRGLREATKNQYYQAQVARQPNASHHNLVMHANECLERLDHEYSPMGGILALVPLEDEEHGSSDELRGVKNSLLGQLLMHVQGLTIRMHEMELDMANMRDALAKDAVAPMQSLNSSEDSTNGRPARELVAGQDRYVLVNAGDGTWETLQRLFDGKEGIESQVAETYREAGLVGERAFVQTPGGAVHTSGVTAMDIRSRVYRLRGSGHSTIFLSPNFQEVTAELEAQPGVLGLVQPRWPERVSSWQRKYEEQIRAATSASRENSQLQRDKTNQAAQIEALKHELEAQRHAVKTATDALQAVRAGKEKEGQWKAAKQTWVSLSNEIGSARAREEAAAAERDRALEELGRRPTIGDLRGVRAQVLDLKEQLLAIKQLVTDRDLSADELRSQLATSIVTRDVAAARTTAAEQTRRTTAGGQAGAGMDIDDPYSDDDY